MAELMSTLQVNGNDYTIKDAYAQSRIDDLYDVKENLANKVITIGPDSTDTEYPSAKAVWDLSNLVYIPYSSPVYADITALVAAGKTPYTYDDTNKALMIFTRTYNNMHHFSGLYFMEGTLWMKDRAVNTSNAWANRGTCALVKTISNISNNDQFPTAKAVYDYVAGAIGSNLYYGHNIAINWTSTYIYVHCTTQSNTEFTASSFQDYMSVSIGANNRIPASGYIKNNLNETVNILQISFNPYAYGGIGAYSAWGINEDVVAWESVEFLSSSFSTFVDTIGG